MGWFDSALRIVSPGYHAYRLWQGFTDDEGPSRKEVLKYGGLVGGSILAAYGAARGWGRFAEEVAVYAAQNTSVAQGHEGRH